MRYDAVYLSLSENNYLRFELRFEEGQRRKQSIERNSRLEHDLCSIAFFKMIRYIKGRFRGIPTSSRFKFLMSDY